MANPPNFKRSQVPAPAPGSQQQLSPTMNGGMPLSRNQVYLSDKTKQDLMAVGWKEGDPVPAELASYIDQAKRDLAASEAQYDADNRPTEATSVQPQKRLKMSDLTPQHREDIQKLLQQAKDMEKASPPEQAMLHPSVQGVIRNIGHMQQPQDGPQIVDDMSGPRPPSFAKAAPVPQPQPAPQPAATPPEHTHAPITDNAAGTMGLPPLCPRCHWDQSKEFTANPTDEDRQTFMVAILSLNRFTKAFEIMDGELVITYRTLTAKESQLVFEQLSYDNREGKNLSQAEYYMALQDYRLSMMIESIRLRNGRPIAIVPPLADIPYGPPEDGHKETPLVPMLDYILTEVLSNEPLRRVVGQHHQQFQRLVESLERQTSEPSFWKGIAQQA